MLKSLLRKVLSNGGVDYDPYDRTVREALAERMFIAYRSEPALGSIARSRLILDIIQETFPTEELTKAYFENLDALLRYRQPLRTPGRIVLGIGSGRSGSTSLAAMLATVNGSSCTHENPPLISWTPELELIARYVREYNDAMHSLARRCPTRVMLLHTEKLDDEAVQTAIFDFVELRGTVASTRLYVGTTDDGKRLRDQHLL
jgi:hypothetical protein